MCKQNPLKQFRTMTGPDRRAAVRAHLTATNSIQFTEDPHALAFSQQSALAEMAKAICWRKSPTSPLSLGLSFFVYLSRDVSKGAQQHQGGAKIEKRPAFVFGRGNSDYNEKRHNAQVDAVAVAMSARIMSQGAPK